MQQKNAVTTDNRYMYNAINMLYRLCILCVNAYAFSLIYLYMYLALVLVSITFTVSEIKHTDMAVKTFSAL